MSRAAPAPLLRAAPLLVAPLILIGAGCRAHVAEVETTQEADPQNTAPPVSADDLEKDLEATVMESYSHLSLGNFGAFRDGLAEDASDALIGVTPDAVLVGSRPEAAGDDRRLFHMQDPTVLSKNLEIHLSADGSVGWVFDEMSYRVRYGGRIASIPIRNTSLFVRDFDRWALVVEHLSYPLSIDELRARAAAQLLRPPQRFQSKRDAPEASALLRLVGRLHNAPPSFTRQQFASGPEALVLLPDRDHELHGDSAAASPSLATLFGPGTTVGLRDYRIGVAKNQRVAWMVSNLVVRTMVNDEQVDIGLRGSYVFVKQAKGWKVVQMHISAPLTERSLGRHIFGGS